MGRPLVATIPQFKSIPWRYCTLRDEQPAARLGRSLLRLGICRPCDWDGSAIDLVERGFARFCRMHGAAEAARIWQGELRIADHEFDLSEWERQQAGAGEEGALTGLYLVGEYTAAASIPIGPTWLKLKREHERLPAALYRVFTENLWKWMRVYDYRDALYHAEGWMEGMEEKEIRDSLYFKLGKNLPACLRRTEKISYQAAHKFLEQIVAKLRGTQERQLITKVLEMHGYGLGHEPAWPEKLVQQRPDLQEYLNDADGCGPGCLICWDEADEISGCFEEEMSALGQNGPVEPSLLLMLSLDQGEESLDAEVQRTFNHAGAMLGSLAAAAAAVEMVREIDDEYTRQHRRQPGFPAEPGAAGLRQEQL